MQFSVPQFTDVEDRIVAGLTLKQFGIVFGAGVIIFAFYSLTKSVIVVVLSVILFGLPAVVVAFGKVNGRPIYMAFTNLVGYFSGSRSYVFRKQVKSLPATSPKIEIKEQAPPPLDQATAMVRMKQLNYLLQQQASQEQVLLDRIAQQRRTQQT